MRQITNTSELRRMNRSTIFRTLYNHPKITKQALAQSCELSMPTVSANLTDLANLGLLNDGGIQQSTGGRRARLLEVNASARHAVGVNITAHHLSYVLLNLYGQPVSQRRIRLPFDRSETYMRTLSAIIWGIIDEHHVDAERILGVGLSVPAIISEDGQSLTYASVLNFTNGNLCDFSSAIRLPCRFVNDATAGGYAALWHHPDLGAYGNNSGVVYLSLNNSVGGAFFQNGEEYRGFQRRGSEFGHMSLYPVGKTCYCGQHGCVDAYLSALRLADPYDGNLGRFFERLDEGDRQALELWQEYRHDLVVCVNNIHMAYDCKVVLGGYVGIYLHRFLDELREMAARRNTFERDGSYVLIAGDELESSAVGAGLTLIKEYIETI